MKSKAPVGLPLRVIETKFLERVARGEVHHNCAVNCLRRCSLRDNRNKTEETEENEYCIVRALSSALQPEEMEERGVVLTGTNAYRAKEQGIVSVQQIFDELTAR